MIRSVSASDDRFKTVVLKDGLNVLLADTVENAGTTASRNSTGKSSLVELLHFLLGANVDNRGVLGKEELKDIEFTLSLDWPNVPDGRLQVSRTAWTPKITLSPDPTSSNSSPDSQTVIPLTQWRRMIEETLFGLPFDRPGISGRSLMAFVARRINTHSFNDANRTHPQQSVTAASPMLAYLLGLDWSLAGSYRDLSVREATRQKLQGASTDPVWQRVVGRASELRSEIPLIERRLSELRTQIEGFRVVPQFEQFRLDADLVSRQIRDSLEASEIDRRNLDDIEREMAQEPEDSDAARILHVYDQLGLFLGDRITRSFDEVRIFHESVSANRRYFLAAERESVLTRLAEEEDRRAGLDVRQEGLLRTLREGGALAALLALQEAYARDTALLETSRARYVAASALEESKSEIAAERARLQIEMRTDLKERAATVDEAILLFAEFAAALYGAERKAILEFESTTTGLRIHPFIESDEGHGVGNMAMFCFDLTLFVLAHRHRRGPDFWIHDSHIFDGVDKNQVGSALKLVANVAERESLQYVVMMNSDDLITPFADHPELSDNVIKPRLTNEFEGGGLFGFRF